MAKIRKYKLCWKASGSEAVTGYKIYWSMEAELDYDATCIEVGKVTEAEMPEEVALADVPVRIGITAVDAYGNESDMAMMAEPYQLHIPKAPSGLSLIRSDAYAQLPPRTAAGTAVEPDGADDPLVDAISSNADTKPARMKYYDDVGYR